MSGHAPNGIKYENDLTGRLEKYPLKRIKKGRWDDEEDKKLKAIVKIHGPKRWEKISIYHPTRNGKQMRTRWQFHLDQKVNKTRFAEKEIATVYYMRNEEKKGWADISRKLDNGRTASACQNAYKNIVEKKLRKCPTSASEYKLLYDATLVTDLKDLKDCSPKEKMAIEFLITAKIYVEPQNKMDVKYVVNSFGN
ncbi:3062_t:CDS:2 [Paraglomus occultum]|uniref:3062_t:CDS:1 n=1 Tax=Paraglomus occultum TaxID=144539 RepID=A0A9N8WIF6_9GLOM|nr:3062_t:CDS:2 [Paraglomus occultum]